MLCLFGYQIRIYVTVQMVGCLYGTNIVQMCCS